jgi:hypothetical protein
MLPLYGCAAYVGWGGEAVELVSLGAEAFGEVPGLPLLSEPMVNSRSAGGLSTLETVGGPVEAGFVEGDLLVEPGDGLGDVSCPALSGVDLALRPNRGFLSGGMAVPPPRAMIGGEFSLCPCLAGMGEIPYRATRLGGLPDTAAGLQVGSGLAGFCQGGFGLAQGGGPIRQTDAHDGVA